MKGKTKTLKIKNRNLGIMPVKVDAEDAHLFEEYVTSITNIGSNNGPMIRFHDGDYHPYASRIILKKHKMLDDSKNVFFKNKNHYDLRKTNLVQV